jgi:hypothetical protein
VIGEDPETIEDVLEPYLIMQGHLQRTPRGPRRHAHRLPALRPRRSAAIPRPALRQLKIQVRVYYQDTDAGGVVYHAQYLSFMERARSELLNAAGIDLARFTREHGVLFVVFQIAITYHLPARLNEQANGERGSG